MRDTRKDEQYFDRLIQRDPERIKRFENTLASGEAKPDRVPFIHDYILMLKTNLLIARFSRGDDVAQLRDEIEQMADDFCKWWDTDAYTDNIRFASMAYLFGADEKVLKKICKSLSDKNKGKTHDWLIDYILTGEQGGEKLAWEKSYHLLAEAIGQHSAEPLKTYLSRWYSSHRGCGWYDTHKKDDDKMLYYGYWCFEAAAVAKRMGIDDSLICGNKYYPNL